MTEGAANLLHGEDLVDGSERREQEELLPWLVAKGCAEEHHRIDEAVARFFWLNAGFRYYAHDFIVLRHHPGDYRRITRNNREGGFLSPVGRFLYGYANNQYIYSTLLYFTLLWLIFWLSLGYLFISEDNQKDNQRHNRMGYLFRQPG